MIFNETLLLSFESSEKIAINTEKEYANKNLFRVARSLVLIMEQSVDYFYKSDTKSKRKAKAFPKSIWTWASSYSKDILLCPSMRDFNWVQRFLEKENNISYLRNIVIISFPNNTTQQMGNWQNVITVEPLYNLSTARKYPYNKESAIRKIDKKYKMAKHQSMVWLKVVIEDKKTLRTILPAITRCPLYSMFAIERFYCINKLINTLLTFFSIELFLNFLNFNAIF